MMRRALFIFRRDLRLEDNTGLLFALKNARDVIPIFIFTPEQIENNPYRGDRSLQFMIESLEDLQGQLKERGGELYLFYGKGEDVVSECIEKLQVDSVVVNRDYTPYSIKRDEKIQAVCEKQGALFHSLNDLLLHPPEETLKADGKPYTIFTPFYRNALKLEVETPKRESAGHFYSQPISFAQDKKLYHTLLPKRERQAKGGRRAAEQILQKLPLFSHYAGQRDFPALDATTHLSPHLKFTTCSVREVYHAIVAKLGADHELIRALYWRDFFTSIAYYFPAVFKGAFHKQYNQIAWEGNKRFFELWCKGQTGFPIVDAGMRQLNATGYMHGRVRMIAASFLVKDLHIDWRWGEEYFAKNLLDYDPAVNNGNWQWVAGTGCDAAPYFRVFNPQAQAKKFDPDCLYIKNWVPELRELDSKTIHSLGHGKQSWNTSSYPRPIVDHAEQARAALELYKECKKIS